MAVGIEQIAGPVNAGDIIMRDEEAPRGAAALLNKMINKGTQGMYKLPEQDKEMPGFMKDAMKESEQAAVDPSDFRTILRILEAGGDPEDYIEQTKLDASDFRTILKLLEQGFSMEEIESMTQASMLRDKAKTLNEAAPEGEMLAYINPEEAGVLKLLGGAGAMTKAGIPTFFNIEEEMMKAAYGSSSPGSEKDKGSSSSAQDSTDRRGAYIAGSNMPTGTKPPDTFTNEEKEAFQAGQDEKDYVQRAKSGDLTKEEQAIAMGIASQGDKKDPYNIFQDFAKDVITSPDPKSYLDNSPTGSKVLKLIEDFEPLEGNIGLEDLNLLGVFKTLAGQLGGDKEDRLFRDEDKKELTREGFMKKLGDIPGGRDAFFNLTKRFDPKNFYKVVGMPQTSGAIEDLAKNQMISGTKLNKIKEDFGKDSKEYKDAIRFNRQIDEARMLTNKKKDGQQSQQGGSGGGAQAPADKPADDMPEPDERAGQFNVGGTMPYTSDRTGGVEMQVPLGRRFQLKEDGKFRGSTPFTMDDVMKYATKGGFQQLEPFQEYLKRRKDFLGEEDPEYFDEEGNVIYGGPQ